MPNLENFLQRLFQKSCHLLINNKSELFPGSCRFVTRLDKNLRVFFINGVTFSPEMAESGLAQSLKYTHRKFFVE
jgi:hypothetical protein